ncbi:unnamed protein product [Lepeophtheirus salmonis]|uniref:(salmon louse) hypothetical protein n=1 Tax=Lepeophtheirus salmonis TaxID=72036 RepID=A0A7R8H8V5_LEPSM|nr:unnamed protein product [Lepeophtheirus salmonis]CAF2948501.1 unnamed protein product [Lepeophtheirus salmonis]
MHFSQLHYHTIHLMPNNRLFQMCVPHLPKPLPFNIEIKSSFIESIRSADGGLQSFSWWSVFIPLWIWKGMAILGACVATHLLLLMFELLAADNLTSRRHLWILVFVPLVFVSLVSIPISIWSLRNDPLKLDRLILWPWEFIFIPLWIVLCISLAGVLYTIIFAGILLRMPEFNNEQRRTSTNLALCYSFMVIPMIVFLVLLTNKLDGTIRVSYFAAFSPLFLTFLTLLITSFGSKGGNQYWFGLLFIMIM